MEYSLMDKNLNVDSYDEYIDKIINIFRLSNKTSSILFDLKINNYKATIMLSIVNQNGEKNNFTDVVLKCDDDFYKKFLIVLIKKIKSYVEIKVSDIVRLSDDGLVTFRLITENNDLFSIDGLSEDDANSLLNISSNDNKVQQYNNVTNIEGIGNIKIFILMIVVLVIAFILIITLVD